MLSLDLRTMILNHTFKDTIFVLAIGAAILGTLGVMVPKYNKLTDLQHKRDTLTQRKHQRQASLDDIIHQQRLFKTDATFVERIARQNGFIRPNETLIILRD